MKNMSYNQLFVPLAIIVAGIGIAGAIIFVNGKNGNQAAQVIETGKAEENQVGEIRSISPDEHILGNFNTAKVFLVEFSDLECPYCKLFHETLKQVIEEYGESGKVAWVYRHFPLTRIHSKAIKEAEATECAAELGGELKLWEYTDKLLQITPSNNGLDLALLPQIAEDVGLNAGNFNECLESGRHATAVNTDLDDALNSGGRGTPHTIVITKDGKNALAIQGAQSIEVVRSNIEQLLKK